MPAGHFLGGRCNALKWTKSNISCIPGKEFAGKQKIMHRFHYEELAVRGSIIGLRVGGRQSQLHTLYVLSLMRSPPYPLDRGLTGTQSPSGHSGDGRGNTCRGLNHGYSVRSQSVY
jgi:hypothetical protein